MDVSSAEPNRNQTDQDPLLMERDHIVDITSNSEDNSSMDEQQASEGVTSNSRGQATLPPSQSEQRINTRSGSGSSSRRGGGGGEGHGRVSSRNPLNSGVWIGVEVVVTVGQIIAALVVVALAKDEHPKAPLFTWVIGYTSGCLATLPILYCRFCNYRQRALDDSNTTDNRVESTPYSAVSVPADEENSMSMGAGPRSNQVGDSRRRRINGLADHMKMALDCFFAVWFVVGNVWIFGGRSSPSDAPKLYRLCIVFLTFSCIGYAMPFILCATICCCLPCLMSVLGFRENFSQTRGATAEAINALPVYKFRLKSVNDQHLSGDADADGDGDGDGGFLLKGSQKKRIISGEDAVCCICLVRYADKEELRELPCTHVFHVGCVDKWLKINSTCPLCKAEVGGTIATSSSF